MKCPKCQSENPDERKFCRECGAKLLPVCPQCGYENLPGDKFCGGCGQRLEEVAEAEKTLPEAEGERKHVTVLFSDLSGYTAMSEKLDPEEVKEITSRIFGEISKVINKYEGFVEKFVGDAVMALFGVQKAYEDDPVRAIRAGTEIHDLVEAISPELEERVGRPLSMHTGINTGLVVTGEVDMEKGTHGVAGDTINLASRLGSLARSGEILVGPITYGRAEGHFNFEKQEPTKVKGKEEPVQVYKVLSAKERPITIHRLSGLRADLIGRKAEMGRLEEAVNQLRKGNGTIFSICGDAGTGKSRLVEEFKASLDLKEIQWREGHAYPYSQNIPYFPLIDLLNRAFQIEEGDPSEKVREKVESGIEHLVGQKEDVVPYVGSLYALSYPEVEDVSPEFWKSRLQDATQTIISALAQKAPTIFFMEDLHWADPSFVEVLRHCLLEVRYPAIVLCVYRPAFSLFTSHQVSSMGKVYQEIWLQDLSPSDTLNMLGSLLKTETIPIELRRFIQEKVEGNPFYMEEVINSLIESETLIRDNGSWRLTRPIGESNVPSTVQGVISARVDRLEKETKRVLQEASVIGRAFLYQILDKMTELKEHIDRCLTGLERLDLIRTRSLQPDLEYMFKHPLTQEVVYNGLLKKERQVIHEKIALVMEQLFHDRLSEFYETLAFHFKNAKSLHKAVDYLMRSGEKSMKRYAVEESNQYYKEAFDLLTNKPDRTREEDGLLIDLTMDWAEVLYYIGDFKELDKLLSTHEDLAESLDDKARLGMFYAWIGWTKCWTTKFRDSYEYLHKALKLGEEIENQQVIGYACTWLSWSCAELGLLDEAILHGERAQEISKILESDQYLYFKSMGGLGLAYWYRGDKKKAFEAGRADVEFGHRHSNIRSIVMGHFILGFSAYVDGDFQALIECAQRAVQVALDPFYSMFPKLLLGFGYAFTGQFQEAEDVSQEVVNSCRDFGNEWNESFPKVVLGVVSIAKGQLSQGLKMLEDDRQACLENGRRSFYTAIEHTLGSVYLQIVQGEGETGFAAKKAEDHFNKAIEVAKEIGAKGTLGMAYLDLGLLHKVKGKKDQARTCISTAIQVFEECEAETRLKHAREALASLG
ncbi:MAG: AAA family ATPase [Proteobacteria bacterium]|nr:AAA family ATPase [Pseudomonadota bacterium]